MEMFSDIRADVGHGGKLNFHQQHMKKIKVNIA